MQELWRRDYNFNVNKDQLPLARFYKNIRYERVIFYHLCQLPMIWYDIIEFNPVFLVIVASHIRPRAMIMASFTSMLRISVKDCDHRSQPDVWGNNDRKHRIEPLNNALHMGHINVSGGSKGLSQEMACLVKGWMGIPWGLFTTGQTIIGFRIDNKW